MNSQDNCMASVINELRMVWDHLPLGVWVNILNLLLTRWLMPYIGEISSKKERLDEDIEDLIN